MRVVKRSELVENPDLVSGSEILQRAVQDLELIDSRKFVIRFYILLHDREVYLYRRGIVTVHGTSYHRDSTAYDVQICHDAQGSGSAVRCITFDAVPGYEGWYDSIARRTRDMLPGLQSLVHASSTERYAIIGGDAVIEATGHARLLELNMYPNLWDLNDATNEEVKQPLLRDVIAKVLLGMDSPDLMCVRTFATNS